MCDIEEDLNEQLCEEPRFKIQKSQIGIAFLQPKKELLVKSSREKVKIV